jgi:hypothetical protein
MMRINSSETKDRTGFSGLIVLAAMVLSGLAIRLYVSWLGAYHLFQKCVVDDAYFYLNIAKNIASGTGATFDGSIMTNGFHPVYAILLVPVFWLSPSNPEAPLHWALTILSVFNVLTSVVLYRILHRIAGRAAAWIGSFIWLFNPYVIMISLSGVEVSVAAFFLSLCIFLYIQLRGSTEWGFSGIIRLALVTALAILSRVDSVFLFGSIALDMLYSSYHRRLLASRRTLQIALYGVSTLVFLAPWFAWNLANFGTIRQISGVTLPNIAHTMYLQRFQTYASLQFFRTELFHLKTWISHVVLYGGGGPLIALGIAICLLLLIRRRTAAAAAIWMQVRELSFAALFAVLVVLFYSLYFWGWLRPWYYLSVILVVTLFLAVLSGYILTGFRAPSLRAGSARPLGLAILVLTAYFSYVGVTAWRSGLFAFQKQLYDSAIWLNSNTSKDDRIGAISAGIYGYLTRRTTDLAGVVNQEAYKAMREKRIFSYLVEKKIAYLVDREDMVNFYSSQFDAEGFLDRLVPIKRFGPAPSDIVVYRIQTQ